MIEQSQDYIINQWLKEYEPINEIAQTEDIHIEGVSETVKNLALQRTGLTAKISGVAMWLFSPIRWFTSPRTSTASASSSLIS